MSDVVSLVWFRGVEGPWAGRASVSMICKPDSAGLEKGLSWTWCCIRLRARGATAERPYPKALANLTVSQLKNFVE